MAPFTREVRRDRACSTSANADAVQIDFDPAMLHYGLFDMVRLSAHHTRVKFPRGWRLEIDQLAANKDVTSMIRQDLVLARYNGPITKSMSEVDFTALVDELMKIDMAVDYIVGEKVADPKFKCQGCAPPLRRIAPARFSGGFEPKET